MHYDNIPIYKKNDFKKMHKSGRLAAYILDQLYELIKPGISTLEINDFCHDLIIKNNAIPAPLNYKGFPKSVCTSVNHVVCHGIPNEKKLLNLGDIINVDVTVMLDGWHGDSSRMFVAGNTNKKNMDLIKTTYECLLIGIKEAKPGKTFGDIGFKIQEYAESKNYSVVKDFCGHGIGKTFHKSPNILHYGKKGEGIKLETGMIFTIEPMINEGIYNTKLLNDGWTAVTKDKLLSAQFEHTIGVTNDGYEIFTKSKKNYDQPPYFK